MIVNVSGRTDIVAFYMEWFLNRLEEGFFMFRNPFYKNLVHRIDCKDIDMFVFCTKNPENLLKNISNTQILITCTDSFCSSGDYHAVWERYRTPCSQ